MNPPNGKAAELQPPHDISGLTPKPPPYKEWAFYACLSLLVVFLVLFLYKKLRRRVVPDIIKPSKPKLDPRAGLKGRLQRLQISDSFGKSEREEYFFELSLILRNFIEIKTSLKLTDMTYREIEKSLRQERLPFANEEIEQILSFLSKADQIKFACRQVGVIEAEKDKEQVVEWIRNLYGGVL